MIKLNDKQVDYIEDLISVTYTDTVTEDSKRAAFDVCAIMDFLINTMKVEETEDEESCKL